VGAARRIRIIAADIPGWPPPEGTSPQTVSERFAARAEHMARRMDDELLNLMPEARLLVFVDGYLTLQRVRGQLRTAGGETTRVDWLGEVLRQRAPADVRTLLVDPGSSPTAVRRLPEYHGTAFHRPLRRVLDRSTAVRVRRPLLARLADRFATRFATRLIDAIEAELWGRGPRY
jgi:hypothetical protein